MGAVMSKALLLALSLSLTLPVSAMSPKEIQHSKALYQEAIKPVLACRQKLDQGAKAQLAINCYVEDLYALVKKGNYMAAVIIADSFDVIGEKDEANAWHAYLLKSEQVPEDIKQALEKIK